MNMKLKSKIFMILKIINKCLKICNNKKNFNQMIVNQTFNNRKIT